MKTALLIAGIAALIVGLLWIGQGSGYFPYPASSFMIDQRPWLLRGALFVVAGAALIFVSRRR